VSLQAALFPPCRAIFYQLAYDVVYDRKDWHTDDHADESEQAAEGENGKQHPEAGQPSHISQNPGAKYVAVKLLQDQDKNKKDDCFHRADHQDQQKGRNRSDVWPEKRDDIGYAHDDTDQHCVRHPEDQHSDETNDADDQGIDQPAVDISAEHLVCVLYFTQNPSGPFLSEYAVVDQPRLRGEFFPASQNVNGGYETDQNIGKK